MHLGKTAAISVERQLASEGGVALGDKGYGLAAWQKAQILEAVVVLRRAEPLRAGAIRLNAGSEPRTPTPCPRASPRAPRHNTRQPASLRRRLSQAFADKVMARSGPIGVALVIDSAELEVAEEISTRLHRIPR
jgi:hypothetical protein